MATLNDKDCAHLKTITMQQLEMENAVQSRIEQEQEVSLFRAAKEDRGLAQTVLPLEEKHDNNDDDDDEEDMYRDDGDSKNIPVTFMLPRSRLCQN